MHDLLTTLVLADHISRRREEARRRRETSTETESPWARVFAWHRRGFRK